MRVMCVIHVIHVISPTVFRFVVEVWFVMDLCVLSRLYTLRDTSLFLIESFYEVFCVLGALFMLIHVKSPTHFPKIVGVLSDMRVMYLIHVIHVMSHTRFPLKIIIQSVLCFMCDMHVISATSLKPIPTVITVLILLRVMLVRRIMTPFYFPHIIISSICYACMHVIGVIGQTPFPQVNLLQSVVKVY